MNHENPLLDLLSREGVLIALSIHYFRATCRLKPADLGLNPDSVSSRLISLGHKKLLPKEALGRFALVESRARAVVESNSFPFLGGLAHFLPNSKLEVVTTKLKELETEFQEAQRAFLDQYAELRAQASVEWGQAAQRLATDPDRLVAAIEASFPHAAAMHRSFGFETHLFQVRAPERLELALITQADQEHVIAARQRAADDALGQIRRGAETFVAECVTTLRQQTSQICDEMLASMRDGSTGVHQRTLNRLVKFIGQFRQMNFVGDREMEIQLERVRQEFLSRSAEHYRDSATARDSLQQGLRALGETARQLAQQDASELVRQFGSLGVRRFNLAA